ncbi:putative yosH (plasmid) [Anoxybacillus sp. B7M1]|uniref:hypothetical protein n=1 Tax=Anoxybacillus sp. B7M1 TaxID=1490057 RepID=UPI0005CC9B7A|nr:hypothetical protein [Anoxybacillus sp. B7M1]ANB66164.1 putative yosH [Anoxybacillus sp. B7M1]
MKFYEVHEPYYALVKARDKDEAIKLYTELVADDGSLHEETKEVSRDYALIRFGRALGEDKELMPVEKVIDEFNDEQNNILLIDGSLI